MSNPESMSITSVSNYFTFMNSKPGVKAYIKLSNAMGMFIGNSRMLNNLIFIFILYLVGIVNFTRNEDGTIISNNSPYGQISLNQFLREVNLGRLTFQRLAAVDTDTFEISLDIQQQQ